MVWLAWTTALALLGAVQRVTGSALTTTINANERTCFYAGVDKVGEKASPHGVHARLVEGYGALTWIHARSQVGFYFAVRSSCSGRGHHLGADALSFVYNRSSQEVRSTSTGS